MNPPCPASRRRRWRGDWVIGSDQVAELDGIALGKPGTRDAAVSQLASMSGREVVFRTAVSVVHGDGRAFHAEDATIVRFRGLDDAEIGRYVDAEQPFDCAGSFKSEGLGIVLFDATADLLRRAGYALP